VAFISALQAATGAVRYGSDLEGGAF